MRNLNSNEMNIISGGTGEEAIVAGILGFGAACFIMAVSTPPSTCGTYYQEVISYHDEITPVYDSYGYYQGNIIDTYQDVSYVPVRLCV